MLTLGIETSCDETSVSVTDRGKVLSNIVSSSVHQHKRYGGVVPEIASRFHVEYIVEVLSKTLKKSGRGLKDVRLIAVTNGPGLVGALLTGISLAKALSFSLNVPLVGVNHILAHLYSAFLNDGERPKFPFIGLVVSGGHTALFYCNGVGRQKFLGQTQDDAVGEAFDKVGKILNLGYPGGPVIEKKAASGAKGGARIRFPKSLLSKDSLDFSFSGIKTAVLYYVRNTKYDIRHTDTSLTSDICYGFQEAAFDVLVEKAFLAARMYKAKRIVIGGGVIANSRLREKFLDTARFENVRIYFPNLEYCMDNAAMVGALGEALYKRGQRDDFYLTAEPNLEVVDAE